MILKRLLRIPALCGMLCILFITILLCGTLTEAEGLPACGVVCGSDPLAAKIADRLSADGFVAYADANALRTGIRRGEVSMGLILPDNLTDRLARGRVSKLIRFLEAPDAVLQSLYRYRAAAYVLEAYAPYLTRDLLQDAGVDCSLEEMQAAIDRYLANEVEFAFTYETVSGEPILSESIAAAWTKGAVALLLFFALPLFAVPFSKAQLTLIARRIGSRNTCRAYALPQMLGTLFLFAATAVAALALSDVLFASGASAYIGAAAVYAVFLWSLGVFAAALLGDTAALRLPLILLTLLSLGFCPVLADLPALLGIPAWPRLLLPPTFFYTARTHPLPCTVCALVLAACALALYRYAAARRPIDSRH